MITFQEYLTEIKPQVDKRIDEITQAKLQDPDVIPMLLKGKRLRAGLLLLVFDSLSDKKKDRDMALDLACALELSHSASLILDDMLDEDTQRRGLPTIHLTKGHKKAMLQTIGVLSVPYDIVAPYGEKYVGTLAQTHRGMVRGVVKELFHRPDLPATKLYDAVIKHKTGLGFSLAALWGCMAVRCYKCNTPDQYCAYKNEMMYFSQYGLHCGKAMQIADDIADLQEIIDGKKTGGFGSETLLLSCMRVDRLIKEFFSDVKNRAVDLKKAKELWNQEGTFKTLTKILDHEVDEARNVLDLICLPYLECEDLLRDAPEGIADLMLKE